MNILEAFKASNCGAVRRSGWLEKSVRKSDFTTFTSLDLFAEDWEPINETLTFERIREECVAGETLLIDDDRQRLYLGFDRKRRFLITDQFDSVGCGAWREDQIKDWRIGNKWEQPNDA